MGVVRCWAGGRTGGDRGLLPGLGARLGVVVGSEAGPPVVCGCGRLLRSLLVVLILRVDRQPALCLWPRLLQVLLALLRLLLSWELDEDARLWVLDAGLSFSGCVYGDQKRETNKAVKVTPTALSSRVPPNRQNPARLHQRRSRCLPCSTAFNTGQLRLPTNLLPVILTGRFTSSFLIPQERTLTRTRVT